MNSRPMNTINRAIDRDLEQAFFLTFELKCFDYWTVVLPARPCQNIWYAQDVALTRGMFLRERDAHIWAHENLEGGPYSVRFSEFDGDVETTANVSVQTWTWRQAMAKINSWPTDRDCLKHDTTRHVQGIDRFRGEECEN